MKTKVCFKCNQEKPLTSYYKHSQMKDGHVNKCKECSKKDVKKNREKRVDYYREYDRKRDSLPHRVEARKAYQKTQVGKDAIRRADKKYRKTYKNKYLAHNAVNNAVRDGRLKQQPCEICGAANIIHAHHDDYSKPLEVRWLCPAHHRQWHKENGEGRNG